MGDNQDLATTGTHSVLWKVLSSLATGAVAYLITNLTRQPQIWVITISTFIAGVALVVQFLVAFEERLISFEEEGAHRANQVRDLVTRSMTEVNDSFFQVNEVTELFGRIQTSAIPAKSVVDLVRHVTHIDRSSQPIVADFAKAEVDRLSHLLDSLAGGEQVDYFGEDRDWLLGLVRSAASSIDATSMAAMDPGGKGFVDDNFWVSGLAQEYLQAQQEAMHDRGVVIRRIFILSDPELTDEADFVKTLRLHENSGILVRVLERSKIPMVPGRRPVNDFVLFDGAISYELTAAPRIEPGVRTVIINTRLRLRAEHVIRQTRLFEELWELGS